MIKQDAAVSHRLIGPRRPNRETRLLWPLLRKRLGLKVVLARNAAGERAYRIG